MGGHHTVVAAPTSRKHPALQSQHQLLCAGHGEGEWGLASSSVSLQQGGYQGQVAVGRGWVLGALSTLLRAQGSQRGGEEFANTTAK